MSGRPRTTSFAEGNKQPPNLVLGGMKISIEGNCTLSGRTDKSKKEFQFLETQDLHQSWDSGSGSANAHLLESISGSGSRSDSGLASTSGRGISLRPAFGLGIGCGAGFDSTLAAIGHGTGITVVLTVNERIS